MNMNYSGMDDLTILPSCAPCSRVSLVHCAGENHDPPKGSSPSSRGARNALASAPRLRDQRVVVAVSRKKNGLKPINSRSAGQLVPVLGSDAQPGSPAKQKCLECLDEHCHPRPPAHQLNLCPRLRIVAPSGSLAVWLSALTTRRLQCP
jgi:hypothetical protein